MSQKEKLEQYLFRIYYKVPNHLIEEEKIELLLSEEEIKLIFSDYQSVKNRKWEEQSVQARVFTLLAECNGYNPVDMCDLLNDEKAVFGKNS